MLADDTTPGSAFTVLRELVGAVEQAIGGQEWRPGAHGDSGQPKPGLDGDGMRFTISRLGRCTEGTEAVVADGERAEAALTAAGCRIERRAFDDGAVWLLAHLGDDEVVVKLHASGGRLVTAETRSTS